jgi:sugar lactone lactonase YvrE
MSFSRNLICALSAATLLAPSQSFAEQTIYIPDPNFAPEGIASASDGSLYVGSLTQGRIIQVSPDDQSIRQFAPKGEAGLVSVLGLHVSENNKFVLACSSDPGLSALTGSASPALVRFERETGTPAGRYELPDGGIICNDITELPDGTILATDSFRPRIYALRPGAGTLDIWFEDIHFEGEGFNLNGIAYDDGNVYVVRYNTGTLHRIPIVQNGRAGDSVEVALSRPISAPDGLNALGDGRFLVVEGGGLKQGAVGALLGLTVQADDRARVDVIAGDLDVPTTADIVNNTVFVVEGQLDHLFDPNAGQADPFRVVSIDLPEAYR